MPTGNPPCNAHAHLGSRHPRAPGAGGGSWDRLQLRVTPAAPGLVPLLVTILRERGYAAGATSEIDRTLDCSMSGSSTSSSSEEWCLRTPRNTSESRFRPESRATFVQGYAGIPGLVAEQVRPPSATAQSDPAPQSHTTASPGRSASPSTRTTGRHRHRLVGHLVRPPGTESTSRVILDEELPTGAHTIAIPDEVPAQASFATVSIGPLVHAFIVGPMPSRTTMARLPNPSSA